MTSLHDTWITKKSGRGRPATKEKVVYINLHILVEEDKKQTVSMKGSKHLNN
jgi:hypothetical protein